MGRLSRRGVVSAGSRSERSSWPRLAVPLVAGGVAANKHLRGVLEDLASAHEIRFAAPPVALCTDNGAMVAWAGVERMRLGLTDGLDFAPRPRWPLDPTVQVRKGSRAIGTDGAAVGQ